MSICVLGYFSIYSKTKLTLKSQTTHRANAIALPRVYCSTPKYYSLRVQSMSLPLPGQLLPPPPASNAQTTVPFQQMLSAVVGKYHWKK